MTEFVDHPAHYGGDDNPYEAIKVIEAWNLGFSLGNTVKYISRAGKKDPKATLQDLKKAAWYLNREIQNAEQAEKEKESHAKVPSKPAVRYVTVSYEPYCSTVTRENTTVLVVATDTMLTVKNEAIKQLSLKGTYRLELVNNFTVSATLDAACISSYYGLLDSGYELRLVQV